MNINNLTQEEQEKIRSLDANITLKYESHLSKIRRQEILGQIILYLFVIGYCAFVVWSVYTILHRN